MDNANSVETPLPSAKTSGLAVASLVLAVCGLFTCGLTAIIGLILGIVALCAISKRTDQLKGKPIAIAGIVVSVVSVVFFLFTALLMAILMPALARARMHARTLVLQNQARQICLAMMMYCEENEGRLPPVNNWTAALAPYIGDKKILNFPFAQNNGRAWAMNRHLDGRKLNDIRQPARTVLIFETRIGSPPAGGRELLPHRPRGRRGYVVGFVDSHIESVPLEGLHDLIWIPGEQNQPYDIIR
jgi:hypothetical protein